MQNKCPHCGGHGCPSCDIRGIKIRLTIEDTRPGRFKKIGGQHIVSEQDMMIEKNNRNMVRTVLDMLANSATLQMDKDGMFDKPSTDISNVEESNG